VRARLARICPWSPQRRCFRFRPRAEDEQRILLSNVPWEAYEALRDGIESASVRMTYLEGWLEITTSSRRREVTKKQI
jgi:hypothetical protein